MSPLANAEGAILPTTAPISAPAGSTDELIGDGKAWGLSTSVDLQDCRPETIRDRDHIEAYVIALCNLIGMKRYGDCQVVHFGDGRVAGYSMIQLIETSLISGHFANDTNRAYLDIFSCKGYDPVVVEEFSRKFFGARSSTLSMTLRH
ncbi:MAG: S-adenosylmethionine decarboxylase [Nitrospirae bacterium]|nr:MAG: S-adenosylmethionine decarboxylase [Nitrospirota bacterium]